MASVVPSCDGCTLRITWKPKIGAQRRHLLSAHASAMRIAMLARVDRARTRVVESPPVVCHVAPPERGTHSRLGKPGAGRSYGFSRAFQRRMGSEVGGQTAALAFLGSNDEAGFPIGTPA